MDTAKNIYLLVLHVTKSVWSWQDADWSQITKVNEYGLRIVTSNEAYDGWQATHFFRFWLQAFSAVCCPVHAPPLSPTFCWTFLTTRLVVTKNITVWTSYYITKKIKIIYLKWDKSRYLANKLWKFTLRTLRTKMQSLSWSLTMQSLSLLLKSLSLLLKSLNSPWLCPCDCVQFYLKVNLLKRHVHGAS